MILSHWFVSYLYSMYSDTLTLVSSSPIQSLYAHTNSFEILDEANQLVFIFLSFFDTHQREKLKCTFSYHVLSDHTQ